VSPVAWLAKHRCCASAEAAPQQEAQCRSRGVTPDCTPQSCCIWPPKEQKVCVASCHHRLPALSLLKALYVNMCSIWRRAGHWAPARSWLSACSVCRRRATAQRCAPGPPCGASPSPHPRRWLWSGAGFSQAAQQHIQDPGDFQGFRTQRMQARHRPSSLANLVYPRRVRCCIT